ncbi:MAG: tetratricopeptide repeat protein [Candidatus Kapabacteria bacterium]|nr:tetratricopeptide repeat protein [Candidatus Kapabacteria bacterium]
MKKSLYIISLFLIFYVSAQSQNTLMQKFQLGQSFEQGGNLESALSIYEELYKEKPEDNAYFYALARVMKQMSKYSELLKYAEEKASKKPNPEILTIAAEMNWRTGNAKRADEIWKNILSMSGITAVTYDFVANSQIELKLFQKAIETYLEARKKFGDKTLFTDNLIKLYISTGNHIDGTEEILDLLDNNFNIALAQGRLFAFMSNEEGFEHIDKVLKRRADSEKSNIVYQEVYSWFLREAKRHNQALEMTIRIDELKNSRGLDILNFANSTSRDGEHDIALKAYAILIERGKSSPYASSALYGYTRTLEGKLAGTKAKFTEAELKNIMSRYDAIIKEHPKSSHAAESMIRLAKIYSEYLNDYDRAINQYKQLIKDYPNHGFSVEAGIELVKVYLIRDDTENASKTIEQILKSRYSDPKAKDHANLLAAMIEYFSGDIPKAKELYRTLTLNPNSDIANLAIQKFAFISENENFINPLMLFAKAEFEEYKRNYDKAVEIYMEVSANSSSDNLIELSYIRVSEIYYSDGKYDLSRKAALKLMTEFPESIYMDRMTKMIADTYYAEKNKAEALRYYTEILVKYPGSIYLHEARTRIRELREEKI